MDSNDKARAECEKKVQDNGSDLRKQLEVLTQQKDIPYKDTIEILHKKIHHMGNLLSISEEKVNRFETAMRMRGENAQKNPQQQQQQQQNTPKSPRAVTNEKSNVPSPINSPRIHDKR